MLKKKLLISVILASILLGVGGIIYVAFFCSSCLAAKQDQSADKSSEEIAGEKINLSILGLDEDLQIGSPDPFFTLEDLDGNKVSLDNFSDKNILLVFWATTCGWCEKERPDLNKFTKEQKNKIEVLAVSVEPKEKLKNYIDKKQVDFTVLSDPEAKTQLKYLAFGTPNHFLIDKQGKIAAVKPGYATYGDLLMLAKRVEDE